MAEILHQLTINASPAEVYRALTDQKGLANWWTRHVRTDSMVNSIAEFTFDHGRINFRMKIVKLINNRAVVWHCIGGLPEWLDTQIMFELKATQKGTILTFAHLRWKNAGGMFAQCSFDWAHYLMSLRSYLEKGRGFPARD
jgi:uncharacterized protein YndB with AHSA1/START domain